MEGRKAEMGDRNSVNEDAPLLETKHDVPYPKSVFFIIVTEFCERFSYTGMRTILTMYIRNVLYRGVPNAEGIATVIYHAFVSLCYFTPLLGGIIADSFLGKYKTILYISILYAIGNCTLALTAVTPFHLPKIPFSLLGLALIGFGTGGIKPCVNAFAGDQFKLPEQTKQLHQFFFFFYFAINLGSLSSNFVTPIMRRDVSCFGYDTCYSLAFGAPALFWIVALFIFILGSGHYKIKKPEGNVALQVAGCVWYAFKTKSSGKNEVHWLDRARGKYSVSFIEDVKVLCRILVLISPLPIYWALYEQQGSTWTLQATRMKGYISPYWSLKPDQMQALNSFLILFFIPLFERVIYPLLGKCHILKTSLQRMCFGCVILAFAFAISGIVELHIEPTYPVLPTQDQANWNVINSLPCPIHLSMKNVDQEEVKPYSQILQPYTNYNFRKIPAGTFQISTQVWDMGENCTITIKPTWASLSADGGHAYSTFLAMDDDDRIRVMPTPDDLEKSREGNAKAKVMFSRMKFPNASLELIPTDGSTSIRFELDQAFDATDMREIDARMYEIILNEGLHQRRFQNVLLDEGGNYILAIFPQPLGHGMIVDLDFSVALRTFVLTSPNTVHMLYLLPQYLVLTLAELLFSITGFTFAYTQAPASMKAVIQSLWLLTIGLGSALVIVITSLDYFERPAMQFFSYSVIMLFGTAIFIILAYRYVPNDGPAGTEDSSLEERKDPTEFIMHSEEIRTLAVDLAK